MLQPMQGFCSLVGCSLRLTLTVLYVMAVGAATVTHSVSDNEEVRQELLVPQTLFLNLFSVRAHVETCVGGIICRNICP